MKYNKLQNSFSSGQLGKRFDGRTDVEEYYNGVSRLKNFLNLKQGGITFRRGFSLFRALVQDNDAIDSQIIEYYSSLEKKTYNIVIRPNAGDDTQITIFSDKTLVSAITYDGEAQALYTRPVFALAAVTSYPANFKANFHYAQVGDFLVVCDSLGKSAPFIIFQVNATDWQVQSFIHPNSSDPSSGLPYTMQAPLEYALRVPYEDRNINPNRLLKPSATSGAAITITAENGAAAAANYFQGDWVGRFIEITHSGTTGVAIVTAQASASSLTASVIVNFGATTASTNFAGSQWGGSHGFPRSLCFHEQRLFFGGCPGFPDVIWASRLGNPYQFKQRKLVQDATTDVSGLNYFGGLLDSDAFSFALAAREENDIQWLHSMDTLLCGTVGHEYSINGSDEVAIGPTSVFIKTISSYGSGNVAPKLVENSLMFTSFDKKKIYEIPRRLNEFDFASDLTTLSEGMIAEEIKEYLLSGTGSDPLDDTFAIFDKYFIKEMKYVKSAATLFVLVYPFATSPGGLLFAIGFNKTSKVLSWSRITSLEESGQETPTQSIGTMLGGGVSVAGLPTIQAESYLTKVDGLAVQALPQISLENSRTTHPLPSDIFFPQEGLATLYLDKCRVFADAAKTAWNISVANVTGNEYNNTDVSVIAEGVYIGEFPVDGSGNITLVDPVTNIVVGYKYSGEVTPMPIEAGSSTGSTKGVPSRINELNMYFINSLGGKYKSSVNDTEYDLSIGTNDELFTGVKRVHLPNNADDYKFTILQDEPYPFNLIWWAPRGVTYDT